LQNPRSCTHGWFETCNDTEDRDDCYYSAASGCTGFTANPSPWGYPRSAPTACHGWGSKRDPMADCDNPRLDQDNISCDPKNPDPMDADGNGITGYFCSPENINLDAPKNGEKFAIGVDFYDNGALLGNAPQPPKPHVNVYCNGERKLAFGFDPTAMPPNNFPVLRDSGQDITGDMWEVAIVEAKVTGSALSDCIISPVHSRTPKANKDGSKDVCVDTNPQNSAIQMGANAWKFIASGGFPANADALCWH
jgi:hypothetical protein